MWLKEIDKEIIIQKINIVLLGLIEGWDKGWSIL